MESGQSNYRNLILITNHFPFGYAEAFLENEIAFLTRSFNKIIIVSRDTTSPQLRDTPSGFNFHRISSKSSLAEKLKTAFLFLKRGCTVLRFMNNEWFALKRKNQHSLPVLRQMFHDLGKGLILANHLARLSKQHKLSGEVLLYSYWLNNNALGAALFEMKNVSVKAISRAHGVDVYESRNKLKYLSFRRMLASRLHRIYCISDNGRLHLQSQVDPENQTKICVSRLGTFRPKIEQHPERLKGFHIVSCSFLLPVKQIHILIEALATFDDLPLRWTHIGDGELRQSLEALAASKLSPKSNVRYTFAGSMTNTDLLKFYQENYIHLFVNTSSSEGIPVTMMEAQSFGIPIVAPDVGGISEIVSPETGMLVAYAAADEVARAIRTILTKSHDEYAMMRKNAFNNWNSRYNAEQNFSTFVTDIANL